MEIEVGKSIFSRPCLRNLTGHDKMRLHLIAVGMPLIHDSEISTLDCI